MINSPHLLRIAPTLGWHLGGSPSRAGATRPLGIEGGRSSSHRIRRARTRRRSPPRGSPSSHSARLRLRWRKRLERRRPLGKKQNKMVGAQRSPAAVVRAPSAARPVSQRTRQSHRIDRPRPTADRRRPRGGALCVAASANGLPSLDANSSWRLHFDLFSGKQGAGQTEPDRTVSVTAKFVVDE